MSRVARVFLIVVSIFNSFAGLLCGLLLIAEPNGRLLQMGALLPVVQTFPLAGIFFSGLLLARGCDVACAWPSEPRRGCDALREQQQAVRCDALRGGRSRAVVQFRVHLHVQHRRSRVFRGRSALNPLLRAARQAASAGGSRRPTERCPAALSLRQRWIAADAHQVGRPP